MPVFFNADYKISRHHSSVVSFSYRKLSGGSKSIILIIKKSSFHLDKN